MKQLLRRMVQWRVGLGWYLLVIIGYPLVFLGGLLVVLGPDPLTDPEPELAAVLHRLSAPHPVRHASIPALGEEPGWRGFALPRLQGLYGPLVGSLVLGTLHALWHLPVYFIPGAIADGGFDPNVFVANSLAIIASTFDLELVVQQRGAAASSSPCSSTPPVTPPRGSSPSSSTTDSERSVLHLQVMAVVALLVIVFTRGRLGYKAETAALIADAQPVPA